MFLMWAAGNCKSGDFVHAPELETLVPTLSAADVATVPVSALGAAQAATAGQFVAEKWSVSPDGAVGAVAAQAAVDAVAKPGVRVVYVDVSGAVAGSTLPAALAGAQPEHLDLLAKACTVV